MQIISHKCGKDLFYVLSNEDGLAVFGILNPSCC